MSDSKGPSYWDVANAMKALLDERGVACEVRMTPALGLGSRRPDYTMHVILDWHRVGDPAGRRSIQLGGWGRRGLPSTLPVLLLQGVYTLMNRLDEDEAKAKQAALF